MNARQYRVLGVDDNEDDLILLGRALQSSRLALAATVSDGLEAIAYLNGDGRFRERGRWPLPDLLVLDIKMPKLDGFGVLDWLTRQPQKTVKVVVLTSSLADTDRLRALQLGADAVHVKPVNPNGYRMLAKALETQILAASTE